MASLAGKKLAIGGMIKQGHTVKHIAHELRVPMGDVRKYLESKGITSWTGAKSILTTRIRKLGEEGDPSVRKELANDAHWWANFLFRNAKKLSDQAKAATKK